MNEMKGKGTIIKSFSILGNSEIMLSVSLSFITYDTIFPVSFEKITSFNFPILIPCWLKITFLPINFDNEMLMFDDPFESWLMADIEDEEGEEQEEQQEGEEEGAEEQGAEEGGNSNSGAAQESGKRIK